MDPETSTPAETPAATPATETPAATPAATPPATLFDNATTPPADGTAAPLIPPARPKYVTEDGKFADDWRQNLKDPTLRTDGTLALYQNIDDMAKALVETKKMVGRKFEREAMPAHDAPAEKWAEWRKLTGAPESPIGYGELRPDNVPKEEWDTPLEASLRDVAHKWAAPPGLVKDLVDTYSKRQLELGQAQMAVESQRIEKGKTALKQAFGADYDRQMSYALQGAVSLGFDPNNPVFRQVFLIPEAFQNFARAYQMNFAGDKAEGARNGVNGFGAGVADRITQIRNSPEYKGERGRGPGSAQERAQQALHQCMKVLESQNKPLSVA